MHPPRNVDLIGLFSAMKSAVRGIRLFGFRCVNNNWKWDFLLCTSLFSLSRFALPSGGRPGPQRLPHPWKTRKGRCSQLAGRISAGKTINFFFLSSFWTCFLNFTSFCDSWKTKHFLVISSMGAVFFLSKFVTRHYWFPIYGAEPLWNLSYLISKTWLWVSEIKLQCW